MKANKNAMDPAECTVKIRVNPRHYMAVGYLVPGEKEPTRVILASKKKSVLKNDKYVKSWDHSTAEGWVTEEVAREAAGMDHVQEPLDDQDARNIAKVNEMPRMAMILGKRTKEEAKAGVDPLAEPRPKRRRKTAEAEGGTEG